MAADVATVPVAQQGLAHGLRELRFIVEGHDGAEIAATHHLGVAADVSRHHRQAAGHGFEKNIGPAFIARGEHEDVGRRQIAAELVAGDGAGEAHGIGHAQLDGQALQSLGPIALQARPANGQVVQLREFLAQRRQALQHAMKALALDQAADGDQHFRVLAQAQPRAAICLWQGREARDVDAIANDTGARRLGTQLDGDLAQRLRHREDAPRTAQCSHEQGPQHAVSCMTLLGAAQRDGHRHVQPAPEPARSVAIGVGKVRVDDVEPARAAQGHAARQGRQRHGQAIEPAKQQGQRKKARVPDLEAALRLVAWGARPRCRAHSPQQALHGKPRRRRDHRDAQARAQAEGALAHEEPRPGLHGAGEQAAQHHDVRAALRHGRTAVSA